MKKIFCIIATVLLATSCICSNEPITESESHREFVAIKLKNWTETLRVCKFEYGGHKYILFGETNVVHDPDCPCQTVRAKSETDGINP